MKIICKECIYWKQLYETRDGFKLGTVTKPRPDGKCHRNPPQIGGDIGQHSKWPQTRQDDFCGSGEISERSTTG